MFKIYNKTYQPIQIIFDKDTFLLAKREKNSFIEVPYLNKQMRTLIDRGLVRVKEIK